MDDPFDPKLLRQAGLVYVSDREPGITRRKRGKGFSYHLPGGEALNAAADKARVARLAIPPAYRGVWICALADGHLQATGYDDRGRKQYRYHERWQALRDEQKFDQLVPFGHALPALRRQVLADAQRLEEPERATLAALVLLLDSAHLRVGNRQYLAENGTYGATTLLKRHVRFGEGLELQFTAKGGKKVRRHLRAPRLQRILESIADLPGRELFVWQDVTGNLRSVDSSQLNRYIADISGAPASAKTFRTWGGTVAAFTAALSQLSKDERPTIKSMAEAAADELANTPAISRKSYIHPQVLKIATDPLMGEELKKQASEPLPRKDGLRADEQRLLAFLESR
ncbi:DNA topoisomerase IB [Rhizobium sp. C1]|uniref:DNA topoisomerase IB n=1 Tax=Rhizobium sp. C1 TaxID=1349799 RepID=UPI001E3E5C2B|nr:DNA topoisomerase IB [Rhizobium sp. C1]MCD2178133.1 DNA topoisomerase IB [Rhizobium sp. C1]